MITNIPAPDHLDKLLCHLQCFFKDQRKKDRSEFELDTIDNVPVFKRFQRQINEWILTVLLSLVPYDRPDRPDRPSRFKIFRDDPHYWGD